MFPPRNIGCSLVGISPVLKYKHSDELTGAKTLNLAKTVSADAAGAVAEGNARKLQGIAEANRGFETGRSALYDDWNTSGSAARFWSARLSTERAIGRNETATAEENTADGASLPGNSAEGISQNAGDVATNAGTRPAATPRADSVRTADPGAELAPSDTALLPASYAQEDFDGEGFGDTRP